MFKKIQEIEWQNLNHAYGSAEDIPQLLQILSSKNKALIDKAISSLYGNIYHQGTIYEATPYTIPFFLDLLENENVICHSAIMPLLASIYEGHPSIWYGAENPSEALLQKGKLYLKNLRTSIEQGVNIYAVFLENKKSEEVLAATVLLSKFPKIRNQFVEKVLTLLPKSANQLMEASFIWFLVLLNSKEQRIEAVFSEIIKKRDKHSWSAYLAKFGLIKNMGLQKYNHYFFDLFDILDESNEQLQDLYWDWNGYWSDSFIDYYLYPFLNSLDFRFKNERYIKLINYLTNPIYYYEENFSPEHTQLIISSVFAKKFEKLPLLENQKLAIEGVVKIFGLLNRPKENYIVFEDLIAKKMGKILMKFGLPTTEAGLRKLLK